MLIMFKCPHCEVTLKVGSEHVGGKGTCPSCKNEVTIPEKSEEIKDTTGEGR